IGLRRTSLQFFPFRAVGFHSLKPAPNVEHRFTSSRVRMNYSGSMLVVGEVIESRAPGFAAGDMVTGMLGWRLYNIAKAGELRKVDPKMAPVTTALGVLGMPGLTAYFGLLDIGQPKEGETVVVSGAAGAVGLTVCQIAKIKGCRVVGIAG